MMDFLDNNIKKTKREGFLNSSFYRVVKADSGLFFVDIDGEIIKSKARSKLKEDSVIVGDFVNLEEAQGEYVISGIRPRRNRLIRPSLANIDQIILMVAAVPELDYLLLDKLIINAQKEEIDVIICLNKSDISTEILAKIQTDYKMAAKDIVSVSAINGEVESLIPHLKGKLSGIAGQSAVGKSTLINALLGCSTQRTGELSQKINRGKNTTTASEIFLAGGGYIVDTPGFSVVDVFGILPKDLSHFYQEFDEFRPLCKFSTCLHLGEPLCAVREAAENSEISMDRYLRYKRIYEENKDFYDRNPKLRPKE